MAREYNIEKTDNTYFADWEPGNGTRYELGLVRREDKQFLLMWLNAPGHARVMAFPSVPDYIYLAEKFDRENLADICPILKWAELALNAHFRGDLSPVRAYLPEGYRTPTGIHKSRYSTLEQLAFIEEAS